MKVKIRTAPGVPLPKRATEGAAGYDLCWNSQEPLQLEPGQRKMLATGVFLEIPPGYEAQIRSRSGLAAKGIVVANSPGTIDSDYRGEIKVILVNVGSVAREIDYKPSEPLRIAQLVFAKVEHPTFEQVEELSTTERGNNGFGSTGI